VVTALVIVAVTAGALLQRATGLGFTLVSGPFLILILDPYNGVVLANALSMCTNAIVLCTTVQRTDVKLAGQLCLGTICAIPLGAWLAGTLAPDLLMVVVGSVSTVATATVALNRPFTMFRRRTGAVAAGVASGFGNVTAGVGGPPLAIYAMGTGWSQTSFVPTVQVVGFVTNAGSLLAKHDARLPGTLLLGCAAGVALGALLGQLLSGRLSECSGRRIVITLALVGGVLSIAKGLAGIT
jgi:uncharacterized membrane protein YfcA